MSKKLEKWNIVTKILANVSYTIRSQKMENIFAHLSRTVTFIRVGLALTLFWFFSLSAPEFQQSIQRGV